MAAISPPIQVPTPRRTCGPAPAFDALVMALVRGDDVDAGLAESVCVEANKSLTDLADAVRARVAEQVGA